MTNAILPIDIDTYVTHAYAENNGVRIHYASIGEGPLIVMIYGFPDFWYTWRNQMVALAPHYHVVALDLRGYNLSDKPEGGRKLCNASFARRYPSRHSASRKGESHHRRA